MAEPNRRRKYPLVNKSHQYRFLALVLIYSSIVAAVMGGGLLIPDFIQMQDESLSIETRALAAEKVLTLHVRLWPAILALICVIGLHSFRVFHRFIGPVYRFEKAFKEIQNGNLHPQPSLRKKDYLKNEFGELNKMIAVLVNRIQDIRSSAQEALTSVDRIETRLAASERPPVSDSEPIDELRRQLETIRDTVGFFRLQKDTDEAVRRPG